MCNTQSLANNQRWRRIFLAHSFERKQNKTTNLKKKKHNKKKQEQKFTILTTLYCSHHNLPETARPQNPHSLSDVEKNGGHFQQKTLPSGIQSKPVSKPRRRFTQDLHTSYPLFFFFFFLFTLSSQTFASTWELCERWHGHPGLPISLMVFVDVKQYWTDLAGTSH